MPTHGLFPPITDGFLGANYVLQGYAITHILPRYLIIRLLFNNFPPQWWEGDSTNVSNLMAAGENQFSVAQATLGQIATNRFLSTATGSDLDNCLQLVGIQRFGNESDDQLRQRASALLANTSNAASNNLMASTLAAALNEPVNVVDNGSPLGSFTVTLLAPPEFVTPAQIKTLIDSLRSAGTSYYVYANIATSKGTIPRVGTYLVGNKKVGAYNAMRLV